MKSGTENPILSFRAADVSDAQRLTALAIRAKAFWSYPKEWMDSWREDLTLNREYITTNCVMLAYAGDELAGFFGLEFPNARAAFLQHLWVDPPFIGKGIGRILFELVCETAKEKGLPTIELVADPNAEAFYLHMGAIRVGEERWSILGIPRVVPRMVCRTGANR